MSKPLRIAIVAHSLNHNNIGRVYPFLRAFAGSSSVSLILIGWDATGTLFPLLDGLPWPIIRLSGPATGAAAESALTDAVRGCAIIHCFKNRPHLRTALAVARRQNIPLVLDLDDWELGLYLEGVTRWPRWRQALWGYSIARRIDEGLALEQVARSAPAALLVNSRALQAHFGGTIAYTAADADNFDPARAGGLAFREAHGLAAGVPLIGFLGTPHPHKGIDDLLAAFALLRRMRPDTELLFVGVPAHNSYRAALSALPGVHAIDYIPAADYAGAYAACDLIAIPQRAVTEGIMQTPAKLILALAGGRPIVATRVGDMPSILGDAGVLVPPEDARALGAAMAAVLDDPARRRALGAAARKRFLGHFTLPHLHDQVLAIYEQVAAGARFDGDMST
jgi:glycosyltransferase involved in cell wall biosynthesis